MIVLDIETTGIDARKNAIVSLGAVDFMTGDEFYGECICPFGKEISPIALEINGFSMASISPDNIDKYQPYELLSEFLEWAKQYEDYQILAGHNIGHFDVLFIEELCREYALKCPFSHRTVDLHSLAYLIFGKSLNHEQICDELGLPREPKPHNALEGAKSEREAFLKLFDIYENKN